MRKSERQDFQRKTPWSKDPTRVTAVVDALESSSKSDCVLARCLGRQYWNRPLNSEIISDSSHRDVQGIREGTNRVMSEFGFNVTREVVDALIARVCVELRAKILTVGGDSKLHAQSTKLNRYVDSWFEEQNVHDVGERLAIDACSTRGFGAAKVAWDEADAATIIERLDPFGVFFSLDAGENPADLYIRQGVPREVLQDLYPGKKADAIARLPQWRRPLIAGMESTHQNTADTVRVDEAWKISRGSIRGRYAMACGPTEELVLEDREYPHDVHQVVLLRLIPEFTGAGGVAPGRILAPYHRWRNQIVQMIYESMRGMLPRMKKHVDTMVSQYGEVPWQLVEWSGVTEPVLEVVNAIPTQLFEMFDRIPVGAHQELGVNQNMSGGQMPQGLTSGQAIRDYAGFADDRLRPMSTRWKRWHVDVARACIAISAENYKGKSVVVRAPGSDFLEEIKWNDVDMRKDRYRITFSAASALSGSLSDKIQKTGELQDSGMIDSAMRWRALKDSAPDFAADADRITAPLELATKIVEDALDGVYTPLSGELGQDCLNYVQLIGTQMACKARLNRNRTPKQLETLRKVIRAAQRKQAPPVPPIAPSQPGAVTSPGQIQGPAQPAPIPNPQQ
jgi:hypothetical protein